jgi:hypothetical protein
MPMVSIDDGPFFDNEWRSGEDDEGDTASDECPEAGLIAYLDSKVVDLTNETRDLARELDCMCDECEKHENTIIQISKSRTRWQCAFIFAGVAAIISAIPHAKNYFERTLNETQQQSFNTENSLSVPLYVTDEEQWRQHVEARGRNSLNGKKLLPTDRTLENE